MALMRFSRLSVFFGSKNSEKQRRNSGPFAVIFPVEPRKLRISAAHGWPPAVNFGKNSENSETVTSHLHEAHPKTQFRGADSRAGQNAA